MKLAEVTLSGTTGNDTLTGSYGAEDVVVVDGLDGDDLIFVVGGYTLDIDAGAGNDTVVAMLGDGCESTTFDSGAGDDLIQISGGAESAFLYGGIGDDTILLEIETLVAQHGTYSELYGGAGDDVIVGKVSVVAGGRYTQDINTADGDDLIDLRIAANDQSSTWINTGSGNDVVRLDYTFGAGMGSEGLPSLETKLGDGDDVVIAKNLLNGTANVSITILGQGGDDLIRIEGNATSLISGGEGDDRIVLSTKSGSFLSNSAGGAGNDVFVAGLSNDSFGGGAGADVFVFGNAAKANGDQIFGFRHGVDRIDLSRFMEDATFVGAKKFSGEGAEVRFAVDKDDFLVLSGDVNGDGKADWKLYFASSNAVVTASDLIL
jgi:Ca2+-binding RTX toxin-like protein